MKQLTINKTTLEINSCSCLKVNIYDKQFRVDNFQQSITKGVLLDHINNCDSLTVKENLLTIECKRYCLQVLLKED